MNVLVKPGTMYWISGTEMKQKFQAILIVEYDVHHAFATS